MTSAENSETGGSEARRNQGRQEDGYDPKRNYESYNSDPLYLSSSDFPGMQLVNVKLNGSNFQKWSRAVKIALKTKTKLGFIYGSCSKPEMNSPF